MVQLVGARPASEHQFGQDEQILGRVPHALAACIQLDACTPNAVIQEQSLGIHYNEGNDLLDYLVDPDVFNYHEGFVSLPAGPGLGIEINEDRVRELAKVGHNWKNPSWRNQDGTVAEW